MKALVVHENNDGTFVRSIEEKSLDSLPDGDVLIKVHYAGLNFKDALSAHGHKGITRKYPHTPGVDAAGVVVEDRRGRFEPGTKVICTSYDLGMNTSGGFAEYIRVPADWPLALPVNMSLEQSMIMGTAAYTAALALYKMEKCGQHPDMGEIVVTGASGGVGSLAIAILQKAGYKPVAASGKRDLYPWLESIGAYRCIGRDEACDTSGKPLLAPRWAGAIDNVGGETLVTLLKACKKEGCVASIGLVDTPVFNMTVYPFILNGVNLLGIDSAETKPEMRAHIWSLLSTKWMPSNLDKIGRIIRWDELIGELETMKSGGSRGRVVLKIVGA